LHFIYWLFILIHQPIHHLKSLSSDLFHIFQVDYSSQNIAFCMALCGSKLPTTIFWSNLMESKVIFQHLKPHIVHPHLTFPHIFHVTLSSPNIMICFNTPKCLIYYSLFLYMEFTSPRMLILIFSIDLKAPHS
jgi:hypothetical protein